MKIECLVTIDLNSSQRATFVLQSVQLDDQGFVQSRVEGTQLCATINADSVPSLLHTLDDYLACVTVAEGMVKKKE